MTSTALLALADADADIRRQLLLDHHRWSANFDFVLANLERYA